VAQVSDQITLRGMRFLGRHGVSLAERMEPQPFEVDVILTVDLSSAADSDELADTVDYSAVFEIVRGIVEEGSFRLIEALAGAIASSIVGTFTIDEVEVAVRKPEAPLPGAFETVEVRLRRRGDDT
jgi:7,8-dihydroneopterin aldolase/epimerase/oxygenase